MASPLLQAEEKGIARDKTWNECTVEERLERVRKAFQDLMPRLEELEQTLAFLENHTHSRTDQAIEVSLYNAKDVVHGYSEGQPPFKGLAKRLT